MVTTNKYTDQTPMPFGKYINVPLENVPDSYLLWLYQSGKLFDRALIAYIEDNLDAIKQNLQHDPSRR